MAYLKIDILRICCFHKIMVEIWATCISGWLASQAMFSLSPDGCLENSSVGPPFFVI